VLTDASTPDSPDWWLLRLGNQLAADAPRCDRMHSYWSGNPPLPFGNRRMKEAYKRLQRIARSNFGLLLIESVVERLTVVGFRAGGDATQANDRDAWKMWQANCLDADSTLVHRAALTMGRSYAIVGENPRKPGRPLVTAEDPRQVIHEADPTNRRETLAALKTWRDDVRGRQVAVVYLPDSIHYYVANARIKADTETVRVWTASAWAPDITKGDPAPVELDEAGNPADGLERDDPRRPTLATTANPFAPLVPVVPFVNRPDTAGRGMGEFEDCTDVIDRINTGVLDRLVIAAMQAYRQRWMTGVEVQDAQGVPLVDLDPGADLVWAVPEANARMGDFNATDLTPLLRASEADVSMLGAISRTPPSYLLASIVNASGDALAAAEVGLVSKVHERSIEFGNSWEQVYALMSQVTGRSVEDDAEVIWADPQFRSLSELASAAVQLMTAGVPWRTRMEKMSYTPAEIDRMEAQRVADALLSATLAPLAVSEGGQIGSRGVTFNASPGALGDQPAAGSGLTRSGTPAPRAAPPAAPSPTGPTPRPPNGTPVPVPPGR
jgi:hypothetical protein